MRVLLPALATCVVAFAIAALIQAYYSRKQAREIAQKRREDILAEQVRVAMAQRERRPSNRCQHPEVEPVESDGVVVAYLCSRCDAQLPEWWGCEDCEFDTVEEFGGMRHHMLTQPCAVHA